MDSNQRDPIDNPDDSTDHKTNGDQDDVQPSSSSPSEKKEVIDLRAANDEQEEPPAKKPRVNSDCSQHDQHKRQDDNSIEYEVRFLISSKVCIL